MRALRAAAAAVLALSLGCGGGSTTTIDPETGEPTATTFAKSYGGRGDDLVHAARATRDGGIVFVGHSGGLSRSPRPEGGDLWLTKLDANGNPEAQRLLGVVSTDVVGARSELHRVRATADGYVAVGTSGGNVRVVRFTESGAVRWAHSYDSGAWLNYEGTAVDLGRDIWPLPDGGFWVVADSFATLRDVRGIGFDAPPEGSDEFVNARSVYAMRLDADGNFRYGRRLTEHSFGLHEHDFYDLPIIRATADGGAVIARRKQFDRVGDGRQEKESFTLIQRLQGDATLLWTRRIDGWLEPADLVQTDDPVDSIPASPSPVRDGISDDGFVFVGNRTGCARLIKLASDGEVEWSNAYDCPDFFGGDRDETLLTSVTERCTGASPICSYLVAGSRWEHGEPHYRGVIRQVFASDGTHIAATIVPDSSITSVEQLARSASGDVYYATARGYSNDGAALLMLDGSSLAVLTQTLLRSPVDGDTLMASSTDGGAFLFDRQSSEWTLIAPSGVVESSMLLNAPGVRTDRGLAVAELAPGRYVVAGDSNSFSEMEAARRVLHEAWLAAYDLGSDRTEGFRWQRRLAPGRSGRISALAPSGDGGVVAGGFISVVRPDGTTEGAIRVVKLDGDGEVVWTSEPLQGSRLVSGTVLRELDATPDGGFITLIAEHELFPGGIVAKLGADGTVQWRIRLLLEAAGSIEPVDADGDGVRDDGFVIAGGGQASFSLATVVRIDSTGNILWSRDLRPDSLNRWQAESLGRPRIRQTRDGGFVLATTEIGDVTTLDENGVQQPLGQANLLVLKMNAEGTPEWGRVYGGRYDEELSDLDVAADGTIVVAGVSDSMGDGREAWILKTGPDGLIANTGCNAFLASMPAWFLIGVESLVAPLQVEPPQSASGELELRSTEATAQTVTDFVTARQCLGSANPTTVMPPVPQVTLTVVQVGTLQGVVTSTPQGLVCGTGAGSGTCSARFPEGMHVTLRAETVNGSFRRWDSECEEGGGTDLLCVVTLTANRTINVVFGAPPGVVLHPFRVAVQGEGEVTGEGLACREGSASTACSRDLAAGSSIALLATPDARNQFVGWSGHCASSGAQPSITVPISGTTECFAQFSAAAGTGALISVSVIGGGAVRDDTPAGINCRENGSLDDCSEVYPVERAVMLTAIPDADRIFLGWGGACASSATGSTASLVSAQDQDCTAQFGPAGPAQLTVQLQGAVTGARVESQPAGISCEATTQSDCSELFQAGTEILLRATPGARVESWQGCDVVMDLNFCRVTMAGARTVSVTFRP